MHRQSVLLVLSISASLATPAALRAQYTVPPTTISLPGAPVQELATDLAGGGRVIAVRPSASAAVLETWGLSYKTTATTWTNLGATLPIGARIVGGSPTLAFTLPSASTFSLVGNAWTTLPTPTTLPTAVDGYSLARLPSGSVLLFGGFDSAGANLAETWIFGGGSWQNLTPSVPVAPGARRHAGMCGTSAGAVLAGGSNAAGALGDTWVFTEATKTWANTGVALPGGRTLAFAAFDSRNNVVLLAGGISTSTIPVTQLDDILTLSLSSLPLAWSVVRAGSGVGPIPVAYEPTHDEFIAAHFSGSFEFVVDNSSAANIGFGCSCLAPFADSSLQTTTVGGLRIGSSFTLTYNQANSSTATFFGFAPSTPFAPVQIPLFPPGCVFNLDPTLMSQVLLVGGVVVIVTIPADETLIGAAFRAQALQFGLCSSDALELRLRR